MKIMTCTLYALLRLIKARLFILVDFHVTHSCVSFGPKIVLESTLFLCWAYRAGSIISSCSYQIALRLLRINNKIPFVTQLFLKLFHSTVLIQWHFSFPILEFWRCNIRNSLCVRKKWSYLIFRFQASVRKKLWQWIEPELSCSVTVT